MYVCLELVSLEEHLEGQLEEHLEEHLDGFVQRGHWKKCSETNLYLLSNFVGERG